MGGYGSGGGGYNSKYAVEDALSFSIYDIIKDNGFYPRSGSLYWSRNGERTSSIGYELLFLEGRQFIELRYNQSGESVKERIPVAETAQPFGSVRYWMLCPVLKKQGDTCLNKCHKLYSPPGQKYFGCRKCMELTYQSCKDSHKYDGLYSRIARDLNMNPDFVRKAMYRGSKW